MVRRPIAVLLVVAVLCLSAAAATPDAALDLGLRAFRAADYPSSVIDLESAATGGGGEVRATALVYLALAQFRLGREDDARETILRLVAAESENPVYATLPLDADAAEFETLAAAMVPEPKLPPNVNLAAADPLLPLPAVVTRAEDEPAPTQPKPVLTQPVLKPVDQRIEEAQAEVAEAERRAAAAEERAQQEREARIAAEQAATQARSGATGSQPFDSDIVRAALNDLRQAEALADEGEVAAATRIYTRLTTSAAREVVAAAAVGLYRTAAYRDAVEAFRRLGALARGEEDLHYYYAVALYEAGDYANARRELACALPFIEVTEEVARYRVKIENSQS
ncbi:MAG TPA: hypothetical protein VEK79_23305 [Thermoanaerobaculia bacterium]|nr:hypothetical protein [Thermoanaerobaculia bacterium]